MMYSKDLELSMRSVEVPSKEEISTKKKWGRRVLHENSSLLFVIACVTAAWMDPLFLYIPFVDDERKCVGTDGRLKYAALISRSLTDIPFIVDMIHQIRKASKLIVSKDKLQTGEKSKTCEYLEHVKAMAKRLSWHSFIVDILAILPIPQLLVVFSFTGTRRFENPSNRMSLNFLLLAQYLPRMYLIFVLSKKFRKNSAIWLKGAFYFFMYILTAHVVGAFWYFNSILRQLSCWYLASCIFSSYECHNIYCNGYSVAEAPRNLTFIERTCSRHATGEFDYGMFADGLRSGYMDRTSFRGKLSYFMWWGLKNLSNYGTNLNTSAYVWENVFAILICGIGLVLFAYLIGHMQECMQSAEEKKAVSDKVQKKVQDLLEWMKRHGLSEELRKQIRANIKHKLKEDNNADMENLYCLPESLKHVLCKRMLEKVPRLGKDEREWRMICNYLKPVIYKENKFVFRVGEPLDRMLFIVEGNVIVYTTSSTTSSSSMIREVYEDDSVYGDEQLLSWALTPDTLVSLKNLPISTENVKCHTKVEGFSLTAKDLRTVLHELKNSRKDQVEEVERSHSGGTPLIDPSHSRI